MYTRALIVEVIITIYPGPLNDMQPHNINVLRNLPVLFGQSSS